jgi:uncharacterized protein
MSEEISPTSAPKHLPVGTQVVTRVPVNEPGRVPHPAGAVGVVVHSSVDGTVRVRFLDGWEASLHRDDLEIRKRFQRQAIHELEAEREDSDLFSCVIYKCVVGSRAYGLDGDESDTDIRGIFLPPADRHWSLLPLPEQIEKPESEEVYWELQKFLTLALKANPNILECLYTPLVLEATPLTQELLEMRKAFLSRLIYQTYNGYVLSQFKKLEADLRNRGEIKWKHAMHLIRLLQSGIQAMKQQRIQVRVDDRVREYLLRVRRGETSWEAVDAWRLQLHAEFDEAYAETKLPERPDYEAVNRFLIRARRSMV